MLRYILGGGCCCVYKVGGGVLLRYILGRRCCVIYSEGVILHNIINRLMND